MAKVGDGDPCWIVEEREDATNVNNWHWNERDVLVKSREKLKVLLVGLSKTLGNVKLEVDDVTVEGVATTSVRKGKLKKIFDLELQVKINLAKGSDKIGSISVLVPEFSWDSDSKNIRFSVTTDGKSIPTDQMNFIKQSMSGLLEETYVKYDKFLIDECCQGLLLPSKASAVVENVVNVKTKTASLPEHVNIISESGQIVITLEEEFSAPASVIFEIFLSAEKLMMITNSPCYLKSQVGGEFKFLDGTIEGSIAEIVKDKCIVMKWRLSSWPKIHFSEAKLEFSESHGKCLLKLSHKQIPAHEMERVSCGWKRMFFQPIKSMF